MTDAIQDPVSVLPTAGKTEPADNNGSPLVAAQAMSFLRDVPLVVTVEIGRQSMPIGSILSLTPSAVIELDKTAGEPLDVRVNGVLIARGEAVVIHDRFGIRLTSIATEQLVNSLPNTNDA